MKSRSIFCAVAFAAPLAAGCSAEDVGSRPVIDGICAVCGSPSGQGTIKSSNLMETSGLVASAVHEDVLYAHNDSGDSARFFALSLSGADLGTFNVSGAKNDDWEDIARGPCISGSCLYIGDIGDNAKDRGTYAIYRVAEPGSIKAGEQSIAAETLSFEYPGGSQDAEVLLVHPVTGVVTIVTKEGAGAASIFELPLPLSPGKTVAAIKAGEVQPADGDNEFTSGSIHPEAKGILMRTQTSLFYYPMRPEQTAAQALAGGGCVMLVADEKQGEAVAWLASGAGYMTAGEGQGSLISRSDCQAQ